MFRKLVGDARELVPTVYGTFASMVYYSTSSCNNVFGRTAVCGLPCFVARLLLSKTSPPSAVQELYTVYVSIMYYVFVSYLVPGYVFARMACGLPCFSAPELISAVPGFAPLVLPKTFFRFR